MIKRILREPEHYMWVANFRKVCYMDTFGIRLNIWDHQNYTWEVVIKEMIYGVMLSKKRKGIPYSIKWLLNCIMVLSKKINSCCLWVMGL